MPGQICSETERKRKESFVSFGKPMSDHLAALELKKAWDLPWLAHFADPWVDNPFRQFSDAVLEQHRCWEREVLKHCDIAVFTNQKIFIPSKLSWKKVMYYYH